MTFVKQKLRSYGASTGDISTDRLYGLSGGVIKDNSHAGSMSNMITSGSGSVKKREGYSVYKRQHAPDNVGSVHIYKRYGGDVFFYLSNGKVRTVINGMFYDTALPFDATNMKSVQLDRFMVFVGEAFMIGDGGTGIIYYWYKGEQGGGVNLAYIPTLYIANTPNGAGSAYEAVNLISNKVAELYAGDGTSVKYYTHLNGSMYETYVKGTGGSWMRVWPKSTGENYVEFETAPGKPDVTGEDNVRIVYCYEGYEDAYYSISTFGCVATFGVGGMSDRVFLSGSIGNPGKIFYSHMDNPLYFADLDYIKVGDCEADVFAMNRRGDTLIVVADDLIYTVTGTAGQQGAIKQDALFVITDVYSTPEPVGITDTCIFMDEPVYFTKEGVCAITTSGVLDERCADIRSATVNSMLLKEDLSALRMLTYRDLLIIYGGSRIYVLDGKQYKMRGNERLYEGFVWDDIPAKYMWVHEDRLFFTDGSTVYRFNTGKRAEDYSDEREEGKFYPINAYWESEKLYPADFKDFKFFTRVGIRLDTDIKTDVRITAGFDDTKKRNVMDYSARFSRLYYADIDFGHFTYKAERPDEIGVSRLLHKKGRGLVLRFENDKPDCPMQITAFGAEYMKM